MILAGIVSAFFRELSDRDVCYQKREDARKMIGEIKFSLPLVYQDKYIDHVIEITNRIRQSDRSIYELYGSLPQDPVGNLRPANMNNRNTANHLKAIIQKLHASGIRFDYVMNSLLLPSPHSVRYRDDVIEFIGKLEYMGVDSVTVTVPYLIMLIKKHFPMMRINASICNEIATVNEAKEFEEMGADVIVLDRDINRDFGLLKKIRKTVNCEIKVLCNSPCLYHCVNVTYHGLHSSILSNSFFSRHPYVGNVRRIPYATFYCHERFFKDPVELIKAHWIRPEDVGVYADLGISLFKIDGRDKKAKYITKVVDAYVDGHYDGNLFHLLKPEFQEDVNTISDTPYFDADRLDEKKLEEWTEFFINEQTPWGLGIQNSDLEGFIDAFAQEKVVCRGNCDGCGYCERYAEKIAVDRTWQGCIHRVMQYNLEKYF